MAWYAYAIVEPAVDPAEPGLEVVDVDGIRAVVRAVDVADYEGERLEEHLRDPSWLEAAVRDHERVVEGLLDAGPVVPMQFGSIFSTDGGLESMLETHLPQFEALLDAVRERDEWGVKLRVDLAAAARDLVSATAPTGGRAYLERRRDEQQAVERALEEATAVATHVHERLALVSDDAATIAGRRAPDGQPPIPNGAYL